MKAYDFIYDGRALSSYGFMICKFGSGGLETISNGSNIAFNTVSTLNGAKWEHTRSEYTDCITSTFQICKHPCMDGNAEVTLREQREIMRWLNRKEFHAFKLMDEEYTNILFEASFNVSKIEIDGKVYGFELEMITNRPYGYGEPIILNLKTVQSNTIHKIYSKCDEEGFVYPDEMEITINSDGDLDISNGLEQRTMRIANCTNGEVLKLSYPVIESSNAAHKIQNDFNWQFFRIATTFKDKLNEITVSLPCSIKIQYRPVIKVGV